MKNLILAALLGALSIAGPAAADHDRSHQRQSDEDRRVLDTKQLRRNHARVEFDVTAGLRRDGLMLVTDGRVGIRKVQLVYSDGHVTTLSSWELARKPNDDGAITIQVGRPPGLRHVRVWYKLASRQRSAELQLVSFGDGYTDKQDVRDSEREREQDSD